METRKIKLAIATTLLMIGLFIVIGGGMLLIMHIVLNYFEYIAYSIGGVFLIGVLVKLWRDIYDEIEGKEEENGEEDRIQCNHNNSS